MKTYEVMLEVNGIRQNLYTEATGREEAQENIINYCETFKLIHGAIYKVICLTF